MQKYFGVTSVGGVLNVIMEAALCPLAEAMRIFLGKDPLAIVRAARDIALGLEFLHKEGMPHLALHPNNVLLKTWPWRDDVATVLEHARDEKTKDVDEKVSKLKKMEEFYSTMHFQLTDHGGGIARAASRAKGSRYAAPELLLSLIHI